jgi:hypothetical protein
MSLNLLSTVLAEATASEETSVPQPIVMGLIAFGVLALALFLVTRLNRDR